MNISKVDQVIIKDDKGETIEHYIPKYISLVKYNYEKDRVNVLVIQR